MQKLSNTISQFERIRVLVFPSAVPITHWVSADLRSAECHKAFLLMTYLIIEVADKYGLYGYLVVTGFLNNTTWHVNKLKDELRIFHSYPDVVLSLF
ncbi:MAG: hypothetical protein AAF709_25460 [Pseudomonadota bacterium]